MTWECGASAKTVIASVSDAIHRAASVEARMDCFVARAPRNDVEISWITSRDGNDMETWVCILAACIFARGLLQSLALQTEGAGRPGARCALVPRVQHYSKNAHALAGHTGIARHSPRNV